MKFIRILVFFLLVSGVSFAGDFVEYGYDGKTYEGYYAKVKDSSPLIFMVHDWDGITDYELKRADMLNDLGYSVFVIDMFGKGVKPVTVDEKRALTGALYKDRKRMRGILYTAYDKAVSLKANVKNSIGMGYCFGGTVILEFARSGADLKAFVPFHGGLAIPEGQDYSNVKGQILVFHGSADTAVKIEDFANLVKELEANHVKHEMITYSGAPHAFTVFGSDRYREDADKKSWKRFTEFLQEVF
jgi:dienelactone hydrolase